MFYRKAAQRLVRRSQKRPKRLAVANDARRLANELSHQSFQKWDTNILLEKYQFSITQTDFITCRAFSFAIVCMYLMYIYSFDVYQITHQMRRCTCMRRYLGPSMLTLISVSKKTASEPYMFTVN